MSSEGIEYVSYEGSCHCKTVTFRVEAEKTLIVWVCNCSICVMKQNHHFIVPAARFKLLSGEDKLVTYSFNTHVAKHRFCGVCGVQAFYHPRSNPDGVAVTIHCIDRTPAREVVTKHFDGIHWEEFKAKSDIHLHSVDSAVSPANEGVTSSSSSSSSSKSS